MISAANSNSFLIGNTSQIAFSLQAERLKHPRLYQQLIAGILLNKICKQEDITRLYGSISLAADKAIRFRQFERLGIYIELLEYLSYPKTEKVIPYYKGVKLLNEKQYKEARILLEHATHSAPEILKARSLSCLGSSYFLTGDNAAALYGYSEALKAARYNSQANPIDTVTVIQALRMTGIIKSVEGNQKGALADLFKVLQLARAVKDSCPHEYFASNNSVAFELLAENRIEEARYFSNIALASSFAPAYPEWADTRQDIELRASERNRSRVIISIKTPEEQESQNLTPAILPEINQTIPNQTPDDAELERAELDDRDKPEEVKGRLIPFPIKGQASQDGIKQVSEQAVPIVINVQPGADSEYIINFSPARTLTLRFINTAGQERLKLEIRHDPDGPVADIYVRDKDGNGHSFFSTCFLD